MQINKVFSSADVSETHFCQPQEEEDLKFGEEAGVRSLTIIDSL